MLGSINKSDRLDVWDLNRLQRTETLPMVGEVARYLAEATYWILSKLLAVATLSKMTPYCKILTCCTFGFLVKTGMIKKKGQMILRGR